tara:strand:+ start:66 stop:266 length:201 start_codon:yes stop_codon:yes gene_type:complete
MSKIIGLILIFIGVIDFFTGIAQCSKFIMWFYGACNILTVFILIILGLMFFFWKTDESNFKSKKKK